MWKFWKFVGKTYKIFKQEFVNFGKVSRIFCKNFENVLASFQEFLKKISLILRKFQEFSKEILNFDWDYFENFVWKYLEFFEETFRINEYYEGNFENCLGKDFENFMGRFR